ncbi:MOSC domain-containing protein [Cytobacillus kochii]|uniref:MOSC domain-containing protein n=1 Tax=Cytobacillus kochii TaxID=859143 RepID=UPI00203D07C3|nr:MOSC domain-containing protein [Cytobacillus kochii]MCM3321022.1 MOSC domain-containing protein [Cytobacillus kochii]MCM3344145.1 MOSC domain-containing protein [Cytobacillus kochii]
MRIVSLSKGKPKDYLWKEKHETSAIGKTPVKELFLKKDAIEGDGVANSDFHGGIDRALCLYPYEHYEKWQKAFNRTFMLPSFGENISTTNMTEKEIYIGDEFAIGETIVEVTQGRVPCSTISKFNGEDQLLKKVFQTNHTGYFFRVLKEGTINLQSEIQLVERKQSQLSVWDATDIILHKLKDIEAMEKLLNVSGLSQEWTEILEKRLKNKRKPIDN